MVKESSSLLRENYFLESGFIFIAKIPTVISAVLGPCVSVCLYDTERGTGGMNHFQLPRTDDRDKATPRYGNVATLALIQMMLRDGSKRNHLEAQLFGGAFHSGISSWDIGNENIKTARNVLEKKGILLVSEDVGGNKGRKIVFNTSSNEALVLKVDKIRKKDWYPYEDNR